eukprot:1995082-Prorocentrum_lima.AAC.1
MTSSLVGSEMCIRDRPNRDRFACEELARDMGAPRNHLIMKLKHVGRYLSVSYTHLTLPTICSV